VRHSTPWFNLLGLCTRWFNLLGLCTRWFNLLGLCPRWYHGMVWYSLVWSGTPWFGLVLLGIGGRGVRTPLFVEYSLVWFGPLNDLVLLGSFCTS
jgi:hypothetical protein